LRGSTTVYPLHNTMYVTTRIVMRTPSA
jgi:hypothetical protein